MEAMKVMTYNLKFAGPTPPNSWAERRPVTRKCICAASPDIIGTQEGLFGQLRDIQSDCPEYDWIGLGRGGGSHSEFGAIFYRKERFEPLEFDHFWLSDTPNVVNSRTWGHNNTRMATWVRFLDRFTGTEFYCVNTHLDHEVQMAKEKGAALVIRRIDELEPVLPVILTGDFNAIARVDPVYGMFVDEGGFTNTWFAAKEQVGEDYATYHDYRGPIANGPHIDWILARGPIEVDSTGVFVCSIDGQYGSDHFPVVATVRILSDIGRGE